MHTVLKAGIEGVHAGLGYVGFLALAGLSARDVGVLTSGAALAVVLGVARYLRARRPHGSR